jgi:predicted transcriptional regulator
MERKNADSPHLIASVSARLPVRLVGRLYTVAAADRRPVETIIHQALDRWLDEYERQKTTGERGE